MKTIGDAVMLRFPTPEAAVVALLRLLEGELVVEDAVLLPRAGAHHDGALGVDGDYYGAAVNLAARVAGQARGGQLLVTERVAMAARDVGAITAPVGQLELRNLSEAVDVYDVHQAGAGSPATDPVCQMRVPTSKRGSDRPRLGRRRNHFCGLPCLSRFAASPDSYLRSPP